jgi:cytochrome c-type biogenesis protein CcmH
MPLFPPRSAARCTGLVAALLLASALVAVTACDRNMEPYTDEPVVTPDLSRIFPEGAERAAEQERAAGGAPQMPAPPPSGPGPAPPPGAPAPAGEAEPVAGTVRLASELEGRVPPGAVLFLIARTGPGGPPTAVKRIPAPSFPLDFELGPGDRMIQALPFAGPFRISARVDADGNAATRSPGDLAGETPGTFGPGDRGVELVIDQVL